MLPSRIHQELTPIDVLKHFNLFNLGRSTDILPWVGPCPLHEDETNESFTVDRFGQFTCTKCNLLGDVVALTVYLMRPSIFSLQQRPSRSEKALARRLLRQYALPKKTFPWGRGIRTVGLGIALLSGAWGLAFGGGWFFLQLISWL
jgi:hypothetical protein